MCMCICICICISINISINSMKFQASPPSTNKLTHLSNSLFKKHCIVSIPAVVLLLSTFLIISFLIVDPHNPSNPQFILPKLMRLYYQSAFHYLEQFVSVAGALLDIDHGTGNLGDSVREFRDIRTGLYCVIGQSVDCNKFATLANIGWQYKTNPHLNTIINQIILCRKQNLTCVATMNTLSVQQISLINTSKQQQDNSPSVVRTNNQTYVITHSNTILSIARLQQEGQILTQLMNKIEMKFIQYYKLQIIYPYSDLIQQYNPSSLSVAALKLESRQVTVDFSTMPAVIQFVVESSRSDTQIVSASQFSFVVCLLFIIFVVKTERESIRNWVQLNFSRKTLINKLYKYTIRDIFTGVKPSISNILQRGPSAELFKTLSQLVDKSIVQIEQEQRINSSKEEFKFHSIINQIIGKYKMLIKGNMEAKSKYILANRFNLQTYINDLCQGEARTMRDYYVRAQDLGILKEYFKFAYLSILKSREEFIDFLQQDQTAMPSKLMEYFMKINQNIHQADTIYEKLEIFSEQAAESSQPLNQATPNMEEQVYIQESKQELEFRVRVYIIPKYLTMLKELDSKNNFAEELGLDRQLRSLGEIVENTRYLLAKHNKSIRNYCK